MITVITGTPGAGKTLYAITKLLLPLIGTTITYRDADGNEVTAPRRIYTNIRGLLIEHELIDGGDHEGLRDWHQWAKPGSVIVFDEFQRAWPPRPNGSKVPDDIQALDTHRHMGVDFVLITQNVMNTDRHVHGLVGRHLHVRRVANTHNCIVYEWDHCSRGLLYAKAFTKVPWRYSRKVFKLYRSADAHTKQPRKLPGLVWFVLAGIIGVGVMAPTTYARLQERIAGSKPVTPAPSPAKAVAALPAPAQTPAQPQPVAAPSPAGVAPAPEAPVFAGCIAAAGRCSCYDTVGQQLDRGLDACRVMTRPAKVLLAGGTFPDPPVPQVQPAPVLSLVPLETGHGLEDLSRALRDSFRR